MKSNLTLQRMGIIHSHLKGIGAIIFIFNVLALLFYFNCNSYGQEGTIDKLTKIVETTKVPADKVDALNQLAFLYRVKDPAAAYEYASEASKIANSLESNLSTAIAYTNVAYIFIYTKNEYKTAMKCFKRAYRITERLDENNQTAVCMINIYEGLSLTNFRLHNYELSLQFYQSALNISQELKLKSNISNCYHNIAKIYDKMGDPKMAHIYYSKELANVKRIEKEKPYNHAIVQSPDSPQIAMDRFDDKGSLDERDGVSTADASDASDPDDQ